MTTDADPPEHDATSDPAVDDELAREAPHDPLRREIEGLRPHDHVEAERLEAAVAERLFGIVSGPTRIGRFQILGRLGTGGVGVVYSAYDPQLERHVAIKLLRDSHRVGRVEDERLLREAHALARIKHPNVVTVHEVDQLAGQVYVVMEFVEGQSLHAWARSQEHSWPEVLSVYLQAGRGLAAAHAAGLVHRDFKPHNAIIGDDGRVRVVDFGLARGDTEPTVSITSGDASLLRDTTETSERLSSTSISGGRFDASLTRPNVLVGTPAYMSPEQCTHQPVGPASDQYSFCVALYEALVGARPFDGRTPEELRERIVAGQPSDPPRGTKVPGWLLVTLRRGMSVTPAERFPSMTALLEALERDRPPNRHFIGGVLVAALAGALGVHWLLGDVAPCSGSAEALEGVWGPDQRAAVEANLEQIAAPGVAKGVMAAVDDYAERWQSLHQEACLAHHRGEQSDALLDARMACLQRRLAALDGAAEVLTTTANATELETVTVAVYDLAPLHPCRDLDLLAAELPLPANPAARQEVEAGRAQLARAALLTDAGRLDEALALAREWEDRATQRGYGPLAAEALLARGRVEMELDPSDRSQPAKTLRDAFLAGVKADVPAIAAEALARDLYVEGTRPGGEVLAGDFGPELVRAYIARLPQPASLEALLLNNLGALAATQGDFATARDRFTQALRLRQSMPERRPIEELEARYNVAIMADDAEAQRQELQALVDELAGRLGEGHPRTVRTRMLLARTEVDPLAALPGYATLCKLEDPRRKEDHATCRYDQALRHLQAHERELAAEAFEATIAALEPLVALAPPGNVPVALQLRLALAQGQGLACRNRYAEAVAVLEPATRVLAHATPPRWLRASQAELDVVLGEALVADGRPAEALDVLPAALETLEQLAEQRVDAHVERTLVRARLALARAHIDAVARGLADPASATVAAELLTAAEPGVVAAGPGVAWQRAAIGTMREELRAPLR